MSFMSALLGSDATLARLTILYETRQGVFGGRIETLFNPSQISFSKKVSWENKKTAALTRVGDVHNMEFKSSEPRTLSIELFFDTYEGDPRDAGRAGIVSILKNLSPVDMGIFAKPKAIDVRRFTDQVRNLAAVNSSMHRPPLCRLSWGRFGMSQFVLEHLDEKYTLFMPDGTPVRAHLTCQFTECSLASAANELNSADVDKKRVVRSGDTLATIAAEEYDDPALWRHIADANKIDNPRKLTPGQVLAIPSLT